MRFSFFKGLISLALLYSLCVRATPIIINCRYPDIIKIARSCKENSLGYVIDLVVNENSHIKKGLLESLIYLRSLTFYGKQLYIEQYHLIEISHITTLYEFHFSKYSYSSSTFSLDFSIFKENKYIHTIDIEGYDFGSAYDRHVTDYYDYTDYSNGNYGAVDYTDYTPKKGSSNTPNLNLDNIHIGTEILPNENDSYDNYDSNDLSDVPKLDTSNLNIIGGPEKFSNGNDFYDNYDNNDLSDVPKLDTSNLNIIGGPEKFSNGNDFYDDFDDDEW